MNKMISAIVAATITSSAYGKNHTINLTSELELRISNEGLPFTLDMEKDDSINITIPNNIEYMGMPFMRMKVHLVNENGQRLWKHAYKMTGDCSYREGSKIRKGINNCQIKNIGPLEGKARVKITGDGVDRYMSSFYLQTV